MTLNEIRTALDNAGDDQNRWNNLPRIEYSKLPSSLQKIVRQRYTPEALLPFLRECYGPENFKELVVDFFNPEADYSPAKDPCAHIMPSFDELTADIPAKDLKNILTKTRNTAIYTIDYEEVSPHEYGTDPYPYIVGIHAIEAFSAACRAYRDKIEYQQQIQSKLPGEKPKPKSEGRLNGLEVISSFKMPKEMVEGKTRVQQKIFNGSIPYEIKGVQVGITEDNQQIEVETDDGKEMQPLAVYVTLSLLDLPVGIKISRDSREVTDLDNSVFNAICTLHDNGITKITGAQIYRVMTGNSRAIATEKWLNRIDECWTRLTTIGIELDTGPVGTKYGFVDWKRNRRIVEGGKDTAIISNQFGTQKITVYTLFEEPLLFTYAKQLNQIDRYGIEQSNPPVSKTRDVFILMNALKYRIHSMPYVTKPYYNHVKYDTLFQKIEMPDNPKAARKKKSELHSQIAIMLDYWCDEKEWVKKDDKGEIIEDKRIIVGWEELKAGKKITGVALYTKEKPKK